MADSGRHDLDENFAGLGAFDLGGLDGKRLAGFPGDGCAGFHGCHASSLAAGTPAFARALSMNCHKARRTSGTPLPETDDKISGVFLHAFFSFAVCFLIASGVSASAFDS